jgi:transcriptional regulator with XRE-family HTH domain
MGRAQRPRPVRLPEKLLRIRLRLGLTQEEMFERLDYRHSPFYSSQVADYEQGKREPPLPILLRYARVAGIILDVLADDDVELPERLRDEPTQSPPQIVVRAGQCPYCGATDRQTSAGHNRSGTRRYECRLCSRRYTPEPVSNPRVARRRFPKILPERSGS